MKSNLQLIALAVEARARGVTYGQLVASTTAQEQREIVEEYLRHPVKARRADQQGQG